MEDVFKKFGLEGGAQDFIGHALALNLDERQVTCELQANCSHVSN